MLKFLIDENMPRSTAKALEKIGYKTMDVRDYKLSGKSDERIFEFAQHEKAVILTADRGFGNILRFPLGKHNGIVIANFPNEMSTTEMNSHLIRQIQSFSEDQIGGSLVVIDSKKIRTRKP
jgi:predicted nuclease of predicted toxin-antitoxin system